MDEPRSGTSPSSTPRRHQRHKRAESMESPEAEDVPEEVDEKRPLLKSMHKLEKVASDYSSRQRVKLDQLFLSWNYEVGMMVIVIMSAALIAVQIDYPHIMPGYAWWTVNLLFWLVFVVEVCLKIFAYGTKKYFANGWNVFDFIITAACGIEIGASWYAGVRDSQMYKQWSNNVPRDFIEIGRLFRLLRLARLFRQINVLMKSFMRSLQALMWIGLLAFLWFYLCACICTVFLGRHGFLDADGNEDIAEIRHRFSMVSFSLFSLFEIMTLEGWTDYARPLLETKYWPWVLFFLFFIFVASFFFLNLITAVVVDRTLAAQDEADDENEKTVKARRLECAKEFCKMIRELNDGEDQVLITDLLEWAKTDFAAKLLCHVDEDHHFIQSMVLLLDHTKQGSVSATQLEQFWLAYEQPLNTQNFLRFHLSLAQRMEFQDRMLVTILKSLEAHHGQSLSYSMDFSKQAGPIETFLDSQKTQPLSPKSGGQA
jgi:voltage-gated sodium channel